jgi:hypothetical protein
VECFNAECSQRFLRSNGLLASFSYFGLASPLLSLASISLLIATDCASLHHCIIACIASKKHPHRHRDHHTETIKNAALATFVYPLSNTEGRDIAYIETQDTSFSAESSNYLHITEILRKNSHHIICIHHGQTIPRYSGVAKSISKD